MREPASDELAQLHSDPIAKRLVTGLGEGDRVPGGVTGNNLDDVKRWFSEGAGRKFRDELADARPGLLDRGEADAYIDSVLKRIQIKKPKPRPSRHLPRKTTPRRNL